MAGEIRFSDLCHFTGKQWEATEAADSHQYTLFGGTRGPGKSYWLRWYPVRFLMQCYAELRLSRVRVGLFCEDYPSLTDRHITKIETEFPDWLGTLKDSKTEGLAFHLGERYGGGVIALRNLDNPAKYKSSEFALMAVDELTQNVESRFHRLRGSLRWPGLPEAKFISGSNPDGPGQRWVRSFFVERVLPAELVPKAGRFAYVPGRPTDNPHLPASYWEELDSLPESLRRAWRDGDWYVTVEGLVYSEFGAGNIAPIERQPDPDLVVELAVDDGYVDPRAMLFIQRTATEIFVFDEQYHSRHLAAVCVAEAVDKVAGYKLKLPEIAIGSPEAKELQEQFRRADIPYRYRPHKIVEGINVVRRQIKDANGYRALQVHPRCRNLLGELTEGYRYPETGAKSSDEQPLDENNHAVDALRYYCFLRAR